MRTWSWTCDQIGYWVGSVVQSRRFAWDERGEHSALPPGAIANREQGPDVSENKAARVDLHALAAASFGIGVICWLLLGSTILNRLFTRAALPAALFPTMAIATAPPAVAGLAWFALDGRTVNVVACVLGGYAVLMALAQLRLIPVYTRLSFTPGFWAFTFSYAAAVADGLTWLAVTRPPGASGYAIAALVLLTGFVAWIAARTVVLAVHGRLFPRPDPT